MKRRDWRHARAKVDAEGCRIKRDDPTHTCQGPVAAAHIIGRAHDPDDGVVRPDDIVPLCEAMHTRYDRRELDLLPYLTRAEEVRAVQHVGIERARIRLTGTRRR